MHRRQYLVTTGIGTVSALAGCTATDADDAGSDADDGDDTEDHADESADEQPPAELDQETLELGEAVLFYTEDGSQELAFRPIDPAVRPLLVTDRPEQGLLATETPSEDADYVTVALEAENVGDSAVDVPSTIELHAGGSSHSHVRTALTDEYEPFRELEPGESTVQYAVFEVPTADTDAEVRLTAEWGAREPVAAEWAVDLAEARRLEFDLEELPMGEVVTIGTDEVRFAVEVQSVREEDDGDETSVFVAFRAENVGSTTVLDPTIRGVTLVAAGQTFDPETDGGDDAYDADELEPGDSERGEFHFRVPASADPETFRLALTPELDASWTLR
ncbi:hypothetical protein [Natronobeatus ordinarius]|uniref:hypothetical protein n=1 Tax=Natronobeatus ordinarius TaxID=2963433 RepID=UPI0020CE1FB7|nr:hypothetical protein [Natronobeatus ordinarius]